MSYIEQFIDARKPLCRPRAVAVEEDWEFLCTIFPEPGFRCYFLGHIISKLSKELKQNGINTYFDRDARPELASVARFLSNIKLIGDETESILRRGKRSVHEEGESGERESADNACAASREDEDSEGTEEARLELARLVVSKQHFPFTAQELIKHLST